MTAAPSSPEPNREDLRDALEALHASSFGWAMACSGRDRAQAEDVLQTAYLRVIAGQARFDGASSFKTWFFGVIRRVAQEQRRSALVRWLGFSSAREPARDERATQEEDADAARTARAVAEGLAALSERQREILHLVFYEEMTLREAAETIGVSLGTASMHYDRGKKSLSAWLERRGYGR